MKEKWKNTAYKKDILQLLLRSHDARVTLAPESEFYILAHKVDFLADKNKNIKEKVASITNVINDYMFSTRKQIFSFDVIPTSIMPEYRIDTFYTLLNKTIASTNVL